MLLRRPEAGSFEGLASGVIVRVRADGVGVVHDGPIEVAAPFGLLTRTEGPPARTCGRDEEGHGDYERLRSAPPLRESCHW
jgi:hypothetical protein